MMGKGAMCAMKSLGAYGLVERMDFVMKRKNLWLLVPFMLCLVLLLPLVASAEEEKEWMKEGEGKLCFDYHYTDEYDYYNKFSIDDKVPFILGNKTFMDTRTEVGDKGDFFIYEDIADPNRQFPRTYLLIQFFNITRAEAAKYFEIGDKDLDLLYGSNVNAMREAYKKPMTFSFKNRYYDPVELAGLTKNSWMTHDYPIEEMYIRGELKEYLDFMLTKTWAGCDCYDEPGRICSDMLDVYEGLEALRAKLEGFSQGDTDEFDAAINKLSMLYGRFGATKDWSDVIPDLEKQIVALPSYDAQYDLPAGTEVYRMDAGKMDQYVATFATGIDFWRREKNGLLYQNDVLYGVGGWAGLLPEYLYFKDAKTGDMTIDVSLSDYEVTYADDHHAVVTLDVYLAKWKGEKPSIPGGTAYTPAGSSDYDFVKYEDITVELTRETGFYEYLEWQITGGTVITKLFDVRFPVYKGDNPDTGDGTLVGVAVLCLAAGSAVPVVARKRKF